LYPWSGTSDGLDHLLPGARVGDVEARLLKKKQSATASSAALRWRVEQDW
jgi:hypothetical protein